MTLTKTLRTHLARACIGALSLFAIRAQADYIDYTVTLNRHWHSEYGSSGGNCWETGSEEFSGKSSFMFNNDGSWLGGTCYTIDSNGDGTKTINAQIVNRTLQSDASVLDVYLDAWEDDGGNRCSYDSGDDCHTASTVLDNLTLANASYRGVSHEYGGYGSDDHKTYFSVWWDWSLPAEPASAAASALAQTSFTANWSGPSGYRVTNYRLYVATDSGFANHVSGFNGLDVGTATSRSVTGLTPGQTYYYRVTAANERGTSGYSSSGSALTLPAAPGVGAATAVSANGFTANWSASAGATTYYLDVATDMGFTDFVAGYNNRACGSASSQSVSGLASGSSYYYRVRSSNASGTSGNSTTQSATTLPAAPVTLAADTVGTSSFRARWNPATGATAYYLDVATDAGFTAFVAGYNNKAVGANTSEPVAGLLPAGTYYYRVRAANAGGTGASSASQTVALYCAAPTGLTASDAAVADRVNLFWSASDGATGYTVYRHTLNDSATATLIHSGTDTFFADTGALPHTTHYYWVRAVNAAGDSAFSASDAGSRKNATPTSLTLSNNSVHENAGANAAVGSLGGTDADDTVFTFTLVSGTGSTDNGLFNISGSTLRATASLDFETKPSCSVRVRVTDPYSATYEKVFLIQVADVAEPPVIEQGDHLSTVMDEDGVWTPPVLTASSGSGTLTWSLASAPTSGVATVGGTGSAPTLAYVPPTNWFGSVSFEVLVEDAQSQSDVIVVQVDVLPVNDAPALSVTNVLTVAFNGTVGPEAIIVTDVDSDEASLTLSASSDNPALLADAAIVFGGEGTNRTVTLTPATNRAGTATITVTVSDGALTAQASFTLTVEKGAQTIAFPAPADRIYGDAPFALEALSDSGLPVSLEIHSGPATLEGALVTLTGAGLVTLRATQAGDANYEAASDVEVSFAASPKALTVTADAKSKTYGDADPALTYAADGLVDGDTLTGALTRAAGENAGAYAIGQGTLAANANYTLVFTGATFTITGGATAQDVYDQWADAAYSAYPADKRAFESDADGDGVPNGIAYAFGDALATVPLLTLAQVSGDMAAVTPVIDPAAAANVTVVVEATASLAAPEWALPLQAPETAGGTLRWRLAAPAPQAFFRVRVSLREP